MRSQETLPATRQALRSEAERKLRRRLAADALSPSKILLWLTFINALNGFDEGLKQSLKERLTQACQNDLPKARVILPSMWNYANRKEDDFLKELCMQFVRTSAQDMASTLQLAWKGHIPPELYAALRENPHYHPAVPPTQQS